MPVDAIHRSVFNPTAALAPKLSKYLKGQELITVLSMINSYIANYVSGHLDDAQLEEVTRQLLEVIVDEKELNDILREVLRLARLVRAREAFVARRRGFPFA